MREIKFRVWDKKYQKMYWGDIRAALTYPDEDITIMQFTGLKDSKGKDIYEADVVVIPGELPPSHPEYEDEIVEVVMDSGAWSYRKSPKHYPESISSLIGIHMDQDTEAEVIGNIYANPELIEGGHHD